MATGTATIDFGAFPGKSDTSLAVAETGVGAGSKVEAWVMPATTADHSVDEHWVEKLKVVAGPPSAGVGFTIYGLNEGSGDTRLYGAWNVGWVWV